MNISHVYYVAAACGSVGFLLGLIAGFCLTVYAVADLSRSVGDALHKSPKGK